MAAIIKTIAAIIPKGTVIIHSQPSTPKGLSTLPKEIPNLTQASVPPSLMLQPMQLPIKPAAIETKSGASANRIMYK